MKTFSYSQWSQRVRAFFDLENGVVGVEWIALASALVVGSVIVGVALMNSLVAPAESIGAQLTITDPDPNP